MQVSFIIPSFTIRENYKILTFYSAGMKGM